MPYKILKNKDNSYRVVNKDTKKVKAKKTSLAKAKKQVKLLEYINKGL
jgi:hypothetical protein